MYQWLVGLLLSKNRYKALRKNGAKTFFLNFKHLHGLLEYLTTVHLWITLKQKQMQGENVGKKNWKKKTHRKLLRSQFDREWWLVAGLQWRIRVRRRFLRSTDCPPSKSGWCRTEEVGSRVILPQCFRSIWRSELEPLQKKI
jgi:hypothetical protein